jgi:predicted histone-like DNA-binding protein
MAVKFKAVEKGQPGVKGGGKKKWYAAPVHRGEKGIDDITKSVEKISTASGADIRAVNYASVDVSVDFLADGYIVRLGDLGSVRITFSSNGVEKESDVVASIIKSVGYIFTPGPKLKELGNNIKFEKA